MNVLSLFDGMSCGRIALHELNTPIKNYYASEVDKFAIKEVEANWPDTIHLGDATKWREWDIDWSTIDLLIGGSPCQGFSIAGNHLAFDDPRSALFFTYLDILNHLRSVNPNIKFMLENVKMKGVYLNKISELLGVEPVFFNSADVTAQLRQRYYWCNWQVPELPKLNVVLQDIIEDDSLADREKSCCIDANYYKGPNNLKSYSKSLRQVVFRREEGTTYPDGKTYRVLTPTECCTLQGVAKDYFKVSSKMQTYRMLGNGWTIPVIKHIFSALLSKATETA